MLFTVPNILTYCRIILIPVVAVLMAFIDPEKGIEHNYMIGLWATIVFSITGISDLVDGYLARKLKKESMLGRFIDPMADKLIHMTVLVMLIPLGRIAAWVVVVLLFREIFITGLRAVAAGEGLIIPAADWGKRKTVWLNIALGGMIYYYPLFPGTIFEVNSFVVANMCLVVAFIYSVASALAYTYQFYNKAVIKK